MVEGQERIHFEELGKLKEFGEKAYLVSAVYDRGLYGTNQKAFTAYERTIKVNGKLKKGLFAAENIVIYRDGYKTIAEGKQIKATKLKPSPKQR